MGDPATDRAVSALAVVARRQREQARVRARARRLSARPPADAGAPPPPSWGAAASNGADDDDGDEAGGALTGGGWLGELGLQGSAEPEVVAVARDCARIARACRGLRRLPCPADAASVGPPTLMQQLRPFDFAAAVRAFDGLGLRALALRGPGDQDDDRDVTADGEEAAAGGGGRRRGGGGGGGGQRGRRGTGGGGSGSGGGGGGGESGGSGQSGGGGGDAAAARVLAGLRALRVSDAGLAIRALAGLPPRAPAHAPAPFRALVHLSLHGFVSRWRPDPPPGGPRARSTFFFSRAALPSLRTLDASLHGSSNCPLELVREPEGGARPPPIRRLRVVSAAGARRGGGPPPEEPWHPGAMPPRGGVDPWERAREWGRRGGWPGDEPEGSGPQSGPRWARGEPLLASLRSLDALAPTLEDLWVDCTWCCPLGQLFEEPEPPPHSRGAGASAATAAGQAARQARNAWRRPGPARDAGAWLLRVAAGGDDGPAPEWAAPMSRLLPGLSRLSRLTSLRLSPGVDWWYAPLPDDRDAEDALPAQYRRHRGRLRQLRAEWLPGWERSAARLLASLPALRALSLVSQPSLAGRGCGPGPARVSLPPDLAGLSRLTSLEVRGCHLVSVGPGLARLAGLRRLVLEGEPGRRAPLLAEDVGGLTALTHLRLSVALPELAPAVARGLPALRELVLRDYGEIQGEPLWQQPRAVLRAARWRLRRRHRQQQQQQEGSQGSHQQQQQQQQAPLPPFSVYFVRGQGQEEDDPPLHEQDDAALSRRVDAPPLPPSRFGPFDDVDDGEFFGPEEDDEAEEDAHLGADGEPGGPQPPRPVSAVARAAVFRRASARRREIDLAHAPTPLPARFDPTLGRLVLCGALGPGSAPLALPPAASALKSLTALVLRGRAVAPLGPVLRHLTGLRLLEVEAEEVLGENPHARPPPPRPHPPTCADDLLPLSRLERLRLSHVTHCHSYAFAMGLPALRELALRRPAVAGGPPAESTALAVRAALFRAEKERKRRVDDGGPRDFSVLFATGPGDDAPRRAGRGALRAILGRAGEDVRDGSEVRADFSSKYGL